MDQRHHHRPQHPYSRDRDDGGGGGQFQHKRFRSSHHHHHHHAGPSHASPPAASQTLSTQRQLYERDFPLYKQPVEVGHFSLDAERRFFNDGRRLRYYVEPERGCPNFDLRDGYQDRFVKRDDGVKENLDHLLRWILANKAKLQSREAAASSPSSW